MAPAALAAFQRGDATVLAPGLDMLHDLTGRRSLGTLPWREGLWLDAEDSLALQAPQLAPDPPVGTDTLDVVVLRLRHISNFTDVDALAAEPGVGVRYSRSPVDVERADLVVIPGSKATVTDLQHLRADGLDRALIRRAREGAPILGVCGGYQLLGERISDDVESRAGVVDGLGLLPVATTFHPNKLLRRQSGTGAAAPLGGAAVYRVLLAKDVRKRGDGGGADLAKATGAGAKVFPAMRLGIGAFFK